MKYSLLTSILVVLSVQLSSQSLTPMIVHMTSGGQPVDMIESSSGYYYTGAYVTDKSEGFTNVQIEIVKTQPNGDSVWTRMIGGPKFDRVNKIIETKDRSLFILGHYTKSTEVASDFYFLKMNEEGNILWEGTYGLGKSDYAWDVLETKDSTFVITGYLLDSSSRYPVLVEIDQFGKWKKEYIYHHFRENAITYLASIQLENEDLIVAGLERTQDENGFSDDIALMRIHSLQDTVWTYYSSTERSEYVNCLVQTSDTSFLLGGYAYDNLQEQNIPFVHSFHVNGTLLASNDMNQYPGHRTEELIPYVDGTFLMTGSTKDPESNEDDIWLAQFDSSGKLLDYFLFKTQGYELPRAMCLTASLDVLIYGLTFDWGPTNKNAVLLRLNPIGASISPDIFSLTCGKDSLIHLDTSYFGRKELTYTWVPEDGTGEEFSSNPISLQLKNSENYIVSISDGKFDISDTVLFEVPPVDYLISMSADQQFFNTTPFSPVFENLSPQETDLEFTWHFGDNDSLQSNQTQVQHEYLYNGSYDVALVASMYGCSDTLLISDMIQCSGGDWPLSQSPANTEILRVYPNPTNNNLTISFENPELTIDQIAIYDNLGSLVRLTDRCESSNINLDVQQLLPGLYYLKLIRENGKTESLGKFIVE